MPIQYLIFKYILIMLKSTLMVIIQPDAQYVGKEF